MKNKTFAEDGQMKVVKFGGSSLASGEQLEKVYNIVVSDPERKVVVVSAPGKRYPEDIKVTDLLIACAEQVLETGEPGEYFDVVISRYSSIAEELELGQEIIEVITDSFMQLLSDTSKSREHFIESVKASGE